MNNFKLQIEKAAEAKNTRIILALDLLSVKSESLLAKCNRFIEELHSYICALKINRHIILPLGLERFRTVICKAHDFGLPIIMDCKINDIGSTNKVIAENYFRAGFDAVIANPFIGWEDGLKPVFEVARKLNRGVILLVYMSHKGSFEGYGQKVYDPQTESLKLQYMIFARKALTWDADGVIVGATYPEIIRKVNFLLTKKISIYSPGIGIQGGNIEEALKMGTNYFIVGRSVILSAKPYKSLEKIRDRVNQLSLNLI
jgi:orotidine-5'-phosphate decarboxylase